MTGSGGTATTIGNYFSNPITTVWGRFRLRHLQNPHHQA
jgi:hypothetical protein